MSEKVVTRARIRRVKKKPDPPTPPSGWGAFVAKLRNYLLTGILVTAPIAAHMIGRAAARAQLAGKTSPLD